MQFMPVRSRMMFQTQDLADCFMHIATRCASRSLHLNADKTGIIWFDSRSNVKKIADQDPTLSVSSDQFFNLLLSLILECMILDSELTMNHRTGRSPQSVSVSSGACSTYGNIWVQKSQCVLYCLLSLLAWISAF
jgi:hypothetical protein